MAYPLEFDELSLALGYAIGAVGAAPAASESFSAAVGYWMGGWQLLAVGAWV